VIGVGVKSSTSDLLIANCDEFIYYDDLVRKEEQRSRRKKQPSAAVAAAPAASRQSTGGKPVGQSAPSAPAPAQAAEAGDAPSAAAEPSRKASTRTKSEDEKKQEAFDQVLATIEALADEREADEKIWGSMIKQTLKRQRPGFNESYHGFRSFNQLLEEARDRKLIELEKDEKSGGYIVRAVS